METHQGSEGWKCIRGQKDENASGVRRVGENASGGQKGGNTLGVRRVEMHQGSERWKRIMGQKGVNISGVTRMETHQGQLSLKTGFKGHVYMNKCRKTVIFKDRF